MKLFRSFTLTLSVAVFAWCSVAGADDGAIFNKSMSRTINVPLFDQDAANEAVSEAEHAFTKMMEFYVPSQAASGLVEPIPYCNIDNAPAPGEDCASPVEELVVAKPLVNAFIYGPAFHVPETAFAHRFFDTYGAVSLDDGATWKQMNLSESADLSSFNIEEDHNPKGGDPLPSDHNIKLGSVTHARGYDTPYTAHCAECHGKGLQGVAEVPSCYSCHDNQWSETTPLGIGPIVYFAEVDDKKTGNLSILGENAPPDTEVSVFNAVSGQLVASATADGDLKFVASEDLEGNPDSAPCVVFAEYSTAEDTVSGPSLTVVDDKGEALESCEGLPLDISDYPGGTYNVFHAVAGNKVLVAWPSRFCRSGQPAYSMTTETGLADPVQQARLEAITNFIREGNTELGVSPLPGFTSPYDGDAVDDLYLIDAFGVAGDQGSIDFAEEGYPQAGIVPFGCVWTARGVLLPGDDPRTTETESSHMVWTKAERLTSGRRDVNRIEVHGVKGAGFVVTWQEDPDGLRPGQGLGPGEGWSGAVAHSQTDAWYSFINEEYFDIVETVDNTTVPIDILNHDLTLSGRPQVFVPMAVPMRLSNNAKCNPPDTDTSGAGAEDLYCVFDATDDIPVGASAFGLKNQCADTVAIWTGNENEGGLKETEICVADTNGDGVADLPNRANTALTRPRTSLQGYDSDEDGAVDSAWVIVTAEESKGLGKFFFEPATDVNGYAIPCEEDSSLTCTEEIGKNIWYFSFDMGSPDTSAGVDDDDSLVNNLVNQGDMLNQAEVYWETGELFGRMNTLDMFDFGVYNFDILNTEIARRGSLLVQSPAKAAASTNGLTAIVSWKQGTMRQGGPADTMLRRFVYDFEAEDDIDPPPACDIGYDLHGPALESAEAWESYDADTDAYEYMLTIEGVSGLDDSNKTNMALRNAVTGEIISFSPMVSRSDFDQMVFNTDLTAETIPCAVQIADEPLGFSDDPDAFDTEDFNWGLPYVVTNDTGYECFGPLPDECTEEAIREFESFKSYDNPYAFANMVCESFLIEPGTNPYYPGGVCADPATNLSGVVPDTCVNDESGSETDCPVVDFGVGTYGALQPFDGYPYGPELNGVEQGVGNKTRVLTWHQCPSDGTLLASDGITPVTCDTDDRSDEFVNLKDQSWYNPLDISKGHRGFLDGDFVMFLYAWSPNWRLNAKGKDRYDLYVRRSFDGGATWTTTPSSFAASDGISYSGDGTVTCERYRPTETVSGERVEPTACFGFGAGAAEHARNVTQHKAMRITTLDPRYASTMATIADGCTDGLFVDDSVITDIFTCDDLSLENDSDLRNPSRYFMVFETGDNTTVEVGEAEPMDLFYSRAEGFGDDYVVWTETDTGSANPEVCFPTMSYEVEDLGVAEGSGFCNEFDNMNTGGDTHASEASLAGNPDGSKMYGVSAQWVFDVFGEEIEESDAMSRRVWWIDDYVSANPDLIYTLPGTQNPNP